MSYKSVYVEAIGEIKIFKRKGLKNIRIALKPGQVSVTQPSWLPYSAGEAFLNSKLEWIREKHIPKTKIFFDGQQIGMNHLLHIVNSNVLTSRVKTRDIFVGLPTKLSTDSDQAQTYIDKAVIRALRSEAEAYLPKRTRYLADMNGFSYKSVSIKHLKRRWGSCSSQKDITFNLRLMSLVSEHIDYVVLHELTHTEHMNHGASFWVKLEQVYPDAKKVAKVVRRTQPNS